MRKLCYVATIPAVVHAFLREHIQAAAAAGYEVTVVCNNVDAHLLDGLHARLVLIPIERKPSVWKDLWTLYLLIKLFSSEHFDIVHSHMPKTGLLAMLAAWFVRIPVRINTTHGEVWATRSGWRRAALKMVDRLIGFLATRVLAVSPSQRDFLVREKVLPRHKMHIIGSGSICGVNTSRFHPDPQARETVRSELSIDTGQIVVLFVGRLNRDKGMLDLAMAFSQLAEQNSDLILLLVGAEEDVPFAKIQEVCGVYRTQLRRVSFTSAPERYMAAADIFCLPSYREGFGLTIIESAACGVPTVASRIYGISDAVEDGKTGLLFPAGNAAELTQCLSKLVSDSKLRMQMGEAARLRALALFPSEKITAGMLALYSELLEQ